LTREFGLGAVSSGVSSYNTARELYSFRRAVSDGIIPRPSHLVIFYCTNDYTENVYFLEHGTKTYTPADFATQVARAKDNTAKPSLLIGPLTHHIESLRNGYMKWIAVTRKGRDYGSLYDPPVSSAEQVRAFKAVLEANLDLIGNMPITVVAFKGWAGKDEFGPALASMPRLTNNRKINVIINTVPNSGYFPLDGHLNEAGSRQLANLIAEQINRTAADGGITNHP
jgi:lysophospholipase L1-like esterase